MYFYPSIRFQGIQFSRYVQIFQINYPVHYSFNVQSQKSQQIWIWVFIFHSPRYEIPSCMQVGDFSSGESKHINKMHKYSLLTINFKNNWPHHIKLYKWLWIPSPINSKLEAGCMTEQEQQCSRSPTWLWAAVLSFYLCDFSLCHFATYKAGFIWKTLSSLQMHFPAWKCTIHMCYCSLNQGKKPVRTVG